MNKIDGLLPPKPFKCPEHPGQTWFLKTMIVFSMVGRDLLAVAKKDRAHPTEKQYIITCPICGYSWESKVVERDIRL